MRRTATFPALPTAPGLARRFVAEALESTAVALGVVEAAELLTSELVTNAVVHAALPAQLCVSVVECSVRVEVTDHAAAQPLLLHRPVDITGGRGMVIVDNLADQWGVEPIADNGKTVWFELNCNPGRRRWPGRTASDT